MLRRIDKVPNGTDIAILQPGGNDRRFFGTVQQRAGNIAEMERRLRARAFVSVPNLALPAASPPIAA